MAKLMRAGIHEGPEDSRCAQEVVVKYTLMNLDFTLKYITLIRNELEQSTSGFNVTGNG